MMTDPFYSEDVVQQLYDDVLIRGVVEFRRALGMLDRNGLGRNNPYAEEMRRGLRTMEAELARRKLQFDLPDDDPLRLHLGPIGSS